MNDREYYPEQHNLNHEIKIWIDLLIDHARFMRNGFDTTEERLFYEADQYSIRFGELKNLDYIEDGKNLNYLFELQEELNSFINFKENVAQGIENCRVLSILPSALIFHIKKEAIFFSGILARIKNEPRPNWNELGLPGRKIASTAPQEYIPRLIGEINEISWEELLFWLQINYEHAQVLSLYFRPEQEYYRRDTLRWGRRIQRLYDNVLMAYKSSQDNPELYIRRSRELIIDFSNFLRDLYKKLVNCTMPGKQMNIWPRVINHMIREAVYFIQVLSILSRLY
jgi:hypothetical protein